MNEAPFFELRIPRPPKSQSPNSRAHWRPRALDKKEYRETVEMLARNKAEGRDLKISKCKIVSHWIFKRKARRDSDNLIGSLKAAFDALTRAGVLADDYEVEHGHPQQVVARDSPEEYVVLKIFLT